MGRRSLPIRGDVFYNKFLGQVYFDSGYKVCCVVFACLEDTLEITELMKQLFG